MPHTTRAWKKPRREPTISETLKRELRFIPVIAVMTLEDAHRIVMVRSWHEERMAEKNENFARHRQIWRECDRRLAKYDEDLAEGVYG